MKRYLLPFVLLSVGSLAGCPATVEKKCPPKAGPCATGTTCDENDGVCKPNQTTETCDTKPTLCTDAQSCNTATKTCVDNPAAPTVTGALFDRMGRPGVNTALTNPFDVTKNPVSMMTETDGNVTKDNYNKDGNVAMWTTKWAGYVRQNLAVLDGLDMMCGNQFAANALTGMPRYTLLSSVLAGDSLHVDTSKTTCGQYLAAEVSAVLTLGGGAALNDCGGRKLDYDVIDTTYSALAVGALTGVNDGIANDSTFLSSFPFLAAPQSN